MTTFNADTDVLTVAIDPTQDLFLAGLDTDDAAVEAHGDMWAAAILTLAAERGIDVHVEIVHGNTVEAVESDNWGATEDDDPTTREGAAFWLMMDALDCIC